MRYLDTLYPLSTTRTFIVIPRVTEREQWRSDPIIEPSNGNISLREDLFQADPFVGLERVSTILEHGEEGMG